MTPEFQESRHLENCVLLGSVVDMYFCIVLFVRQRNYARLSEYSSTEVYSHILKKVLTAFTER